MLRELRDLAEQSLDQAGRFLDQLGWFLDQAGQFLDLSVRLLASGSKCSNDVGWLLRVRPHWS